MAGYLLSFADIKETSFSLHARKSARPLWTFITALLSSGEGAVNGFRAGFWNKISYDMENYVATLSLKALSGYLYRHYGKKVILLLDEYDTPLQEAGCPDTGRSSPISCEVFSMLLSRPIPFWNGRS